MERYLILTLGLMLFLSCGKENSSLGSDCAMNMRSKFKGEIRCTKKGEMESNLYKGTYENKTVYFTMTMCSNCLTAPPSFGYTCDMEKVNFEDFNVNMKDISQVYNSCTKQFTE